MIDEGENELGLFSGRVHEKDNRWWGWVPFTDMIGFRCAAKLYMSKISHNFIF